MVANILFSISSDSLKVANGFISVTVSLRAEKKKIILVNVS